MGNDPNRTFDLRSCRDVCEKLQRELQDLQNETDRERRTDHALNFAVTAWHLIDWIWEARERGILEFRRELATAAQQWPSGPEGFSEFRKYICAKCPQLRYCDVIATSAKHLAVEPRKKRPEIETTASASLTISGIPILKIVDGQDRLETGQIFAGILDFWSEFVYGQTIER